MKRGHLPGSTASRMLAFFSANPYERLTWADAQIKFGCTRQAVERAARELAESGDVTITPPQRLLKTIRGARG